MGRRVGLAGAVGLEQRGRFLDFQDDVERVLNGVKPHLCVSDPQYGVNYDPAWR